MSLNDINKDELQDFAREVGVDDDGKKAELVERLETEGYTEDDVKNFQEGTFEPTREEPEEGAEFVVDHEAYDNRDPEEEVKRVEESTGLRATEDEEKKEDKVLIKMDAPFGSIRTHGVVFTREHPYAAVNKDVAEELLKSNSFRQAHPSEAEEYYS